MSMTRSNEIELSIRQCYESRVHVAHKDDLRDPSHKVTAMYVQNFIERIVNFYKRVSLLMIVR
jgi:hypothetical protein